MGLNKPFQGTNLDEIDPGNNPADRVLRPVDLFLEDKKAPRLLAPLESQTGSGAPTMVKFSMP